MISDRVSGISAREPCGPSPLGFPPMNGENRLIEIKTLNPQVQAFREMQPAAVQYPGDHVVGIGQFVQHRIDLFPAEHHRHIAPTFGAGDEE